jgi:hypothetical protein
MKDRRYFNRFKVDYPVKFKKGKKVSSGICKNIGAAGMGLEINTWIKPESSLEVWILLPNGKAPIHTEGKLIWINELSSQKWRAGLGFKRKKLMEFWRIFG